MPLGGYCEKCQRWVWVSGYGVLIELYQGLLPWRSFGWDDVLWNTAGVVGATFTLEAARALRNALTLNKV